MAHTVAHVPLFVSPAFEGITGRGLYADAMYEMDWSVGQILAHLAALGVEQDTLVVFTSDNGACNAATTGPEPPNHPNANEPWRWTCGRNAPFSGYKHTFLEGGVRAPFVARWPGVLPAGASRTTVGSVLDLLPTIAAITGAALPDDREIDGEDLFAVWTVDAPRLSDGLYFYRLFAGPEWGTREQVAVRRGSWKQFFKPGFENWKLHELVNDPTETEPLNEPPTSASLNDFGRTFECALDDPFEPGVETNNLALDRPMWASTSISCSTSGRAVDGDPGTRWASIPDQPQWLEVDLGLSAQVKSLVVLRWGPAYARRYTLQTSDDRQLWTEVFREQAGDGGLDVIPLTLQQRYLRVDCIESASAGFQLRELEVQDLLAPVGLSKH
jgi:hypothetical protein